MASIINAATSGGLISTADTSGVLQLQTAGTTAVTVDASQNVGVGTSSPSNRLSVVTASGSDGFVSVKSPLTDTAGVVVDGGTTSNKGAILKFLKNAVVKWQMGTDSAIIGGTSDNFHLYGGGADAMLFSTNATERARIPSTGGIQSKTTISVGDATPSASGAGITFPASQSASSDANTLDDYEEGTWTPGASFGGGTTGITYHADNGGRYTRVGSIVTLTGYLRLTNKGSSTGVARITGLPFMPTGTGETGNFANAMGYTINITYSGTLAFYASSGATSLFAISNSSGATSTVLTDTAFANTTATVISLSYFAT